MICIMCGRDIDQLGQDNMSPVPGLPVCEDCAGTSYFHMWSENAMTRQLTFQDEYGYMTIQSIPEGFEFIHYNNKWDELGSGVIQQPDILIVDAARKALADIGFNILECPVMNDREMEQRVFLRSMERLERYPIDLTSQNGRREVWLDGYSRVDVEYMILDRIIEQAEKAEVRGTCFKEEWHLLLALDHDLTIQLLEDLCSASHFCLLGARVFGRTEVCTNIHVMLFYRGVLSEELIPDNLCCGKLPVKIHPVCVTREDDLRRLLEKAEKELEEENG